MVIAMKNLDAKAAMSAKNLEKYKEQGEILERRNEALTLKGIELMNEKREWDGQYREVQDNPGIPPEVKEDLLDKIDYIRDKLENLHEEQVEKPETELRDEYEELQKEIEQVRENLKNQKNDLRNTDIDAIADVMVIASREIDEYSNQLETLGVDLLNDEVSFAEGIDLQKKFMEERYKKI